MPEVTIVVKLRRIWVGKLAAVDEHLVLPDGRGVARARPRLEASGVDLEPAVVPWNRKQSVREDLEITRSLL